jgi:hypothetical protein
MNLLVSAIDSIASSKGLPAEDVRTVYERMLARIKRQALIKDFLSIFVARRVERVLKRKKGILERFARRRKENGYHDISSA